MDGRVRILFIDDFVPDRAIGAGAPRADEFLRALSGAGVAVTFFPTMPRPDGRKLTYPGLAGVRYIDQGGLAALANFLRKSRYRFDAIIVSRRHNLIAFNAALDACPGIADGAVIVFDSEAIFAVREDLQRQLTGRAMASGEMSVAEEVELARKASVVIAVNEIDAAPFLAAGYPDVRVIGHAVTPAAGMQPHSVRTDFLFVGPVYGNETPNGDSVTWFVDNVLPSIRHMLGDQARLAHVGSVDASAIAARAPGLIDLRGPRADLRPEFERARVFVAPTRFASGIPLKVCEAAAHGVPCVLTPVLARQLGWTHEVEALVAETPEAFAEACLRLWADEVLWQRIRDAAFARISRDCDRGRFDGEVGALCDHIRLALAGPAAAREVA